LNLKALIDIRILPVCRDYPPIHATLFRLVVHTTREPPGS
jgi:hypothetical protein